MRADQLVLVVDDSAIEKRLRDRVDDNPCAVLFDHDVIIGRRRLKVEFVLKARASAAQNGNAEHLISALAREDGAQLGKDRVSYADTVEGCGRGVHWSKLHRFRAFGTIAHSHAKDRNKPAMMMVEHLQPYAVDPRASRGRLVDEEESSHRSPHQRDRDRILHSAAFRKLKHKTQVFVAHEGDYYRTRLTHSLEVAQIARSAARTLRLNEDLAEAVALAHDLGHTPFGHAGETALDEAMGPYEGFDHNAQALRVVTKLEQRYALFDGLNLTWETLEGLVKHNGPLLGTADAARDALPFAIREYCAKQDLELHTRASLEAQIAALADDIAYNNHDFDDGLRAGFFTLDKVAELPLIGEKIRAVDALYPGLDETRRSHEALRRLFSAMVEDLLTETRRRVAEVAPKTPEAVREHSEALAGFSDGMDAAFAEIRKFLFKRMYRHYRVNRMMAKAQRVLEEMFPLLFEQPNLLPPGWSEAALAAKGNARARIVADYIAGMTDNYALDEYKRLTDPYELA